MAKALTSTSLIKKATCANILSILLLAVQTLEAATSSGSDFWSNPCSTHPIRQVRSTAEKELNFFITTLNKEMIKELKELYPKSSKKIKGNCPRLNKLIDPIKNAKDIETAHQRFYTSMNEIAVYLNDLKKIEIDTQNKFDSEKRRKIYEKTGSTLRLTICEFNDTIMNQFKVHSISPAKPPKVRTNCVPKQADFSRVQMLDLQFFDKLKKFFKQGKKYLKIIKRRVSGRAKGGKVKRTK